MQRHHVVFILAALLVAAGIALMTYREPEVLQDGDEVPDGEEVSPSAEAQPYFWPGVLVFVVGVVLAGWAYQKYRQRPRP